MDDSRAATLELQFYFFSRVHRDCNRVADKLAKNSKVMFSPVVWFENIPDNVSSLVTHDRLHMLI